jgi:hypothetical protein
VEVARHPSRRRHHAPAHLEPAPPLAAVKQETPPVYQEQWTKLLDMADDIRIFMRSNEASLKAKELTDPATTPLADHDVGRSPLYYRSLQLPVSRLVARAG